MAFDINELTAEQRANFGGLTPLAQLLKGQIGGVAFGFMLPILAGFIAMSIADRPGLAVGFVGGAIAASGKSGFLGALAAGFLAGYLVNLLKKVSDKVIPDSLDGIKPVLIYPLFGMLLIGLTMIFAIEPVVGALNTGLNNFLGSLSGVNSILLGIDRCRYDGDRYGWPFQQGFLRLRCCFHRCRQLQHHGCRYDRRYGTSLRDRPGYDPVQEQVHGIREKIRSDKLHHGSLIHYRRRDPVRSC